MKARSHEAAREAVGNALIPLAGRAPTFGLLFVSPSLEAGACVAAAKVLVPGLDWVACSTAGEISERGATHGGLVAFVAASDELATHSTTTRRLATVATASKDLVAGTTEFAEAARARGFGHSTALLVADGLSPSLDGLMAQLRKDTSFSQQLVGGGAGDETNLRATQVVVQGEALSGAAAMLHLFGRKPWGIGVGHGLRPVSPPMTVTRVEGNTVLELNGRPALEAYRELARQENVSLDAANTGAFLLTHELGVLLFDNIYKVRAPLGVTPGGGLVCAGAVDAGAQVAIVKAEPAAMRDAVRQASIEARKNLQGAEAAGVLVFSCVCRGMVLGPAFQAEIDTIRETFPGVPLGGMLSYGEIARYAGRLNGYHNNTVVIAAVPA